MSGRRFREGALVEICAAQVAAEDGSPVEALGAFAQLQSYDHAGAAWRAMTLDGRRVRVAAADARLLEAGQLPGVDLVLGPGADEAAATREMAAQLAAKGYCAVRRLLPASALAEMQEAAEGLAYTRSHADFEPHFLGRDSRERHVLVDLDSAEGADLRATPLAEQDALFERLCGALAEPLEEHLGVRVQSRTNLLLRQTFRDEDEEADFPPPSEPTAAERESFLSLVRRRRVLMLQCLGPLGGRILLSGQGEELELEAAPGLLVLLMTERLRLSHRGPEGRTLLCQSWLLGPRPEFQLGDVGGDLEALGGLEAGAEPPPGETVAVSGMGVCLGCDSKDFLCYWLMVNKAGGDSFVEIPMMRWDLDVYCLTYDMQTAQVSGRSYTKHQGYIDGVEYFDNRFFGISTAEAASMDPNQRKCLENTYEALQMGGHDLKSLQRDPKHIGIFVGVSGSEWGSVPHPIDAAGCGGAEAIISNRCNFSMNLKGPSQTINTACSSGLVAMHTAKLHLKYKDFDPLVAVIGAGINMAYSPMPFVGCCSGGMLSYKGRSFTFDVAADGYGRGEGVSSVYMNLQPYSREVFALVAGSQANQDGRSASITAPNGPSQEKCIRAAFREASLRPPEVDCFECHGTGTALGDPIEVGAFKRIYNAAPRQHTLIVTTSKTNLGHLEGGAGMAGFIKCCLQVMRAEGSPNLHLRECNPHLDNEGFPAYFTTEPMVCQYDSAYAGVSSFGFGGTNAHSMSYGRNTTTSRGAGQRDYRQVMRDRIAQAPPAEVLMRGEDPEDWESSGMPLEEEKAGRLFQVEVLADGRATWREVVGAPAARRGERFYLSGTCNEWGLEPMLEDAALPGLFCCEVSVGPMGEELFHVVCDEDPQLCYYPAQARCSRRGAPVAGPEPVAGDPEDSSWSIQAQPGARVRVELHLSAESVSVTWLRCREAISS